MKKNKKNNHFDEGYGETLFRVEFSPDFQMYSASEEQKSVHMIHFIL